VFLLGLIHADYVETETVFGLLLWDTKTVNSSERHDDIDANLYWRLVVG